MLAGYFSLTIVTVEDIPAAELLMPAIHLAEGG
jgi:hypothetical protein